MEWQLEIITQIVGSVLPALVLGCLHLCFKKNLSRKALLILLALGLFYYEAHEVTLPLLFPNLNDPAIPVVYAGVLTLGLLITRLIPRRERSFDRVLFCGASAAVLAGIYIVHAVLVSHIMAGQYRDLERAHANALLASPEFDQRTRTYCALAEVACTVTPSEPDVQSRLPMPEVMASFTDNQRLVRTGSRITPEYQNHTVVIIEYPNDTLILRDTINAQRLFTDTKFLVYLWILIIMIGWCGGGLWVSLYHRKRIFKRRPDIFAEDTIRPEPSANRAP